MKDLSTYISEACSISEARTLKDLKGKQVSKIVVGDGNVSWNKINGVYSVNYKRWATINDIDGLEGKDIDEMYKVYEKEGALYVGFEYGGHVWYMEFRNAPDHRIAVQMYKDDVHVNRAAIFTGLLNFREFWDQTIPKILAAY